ncbi:MAG: TMEM165/GDT1 family protein [Endomicrobium sp.]|jgi:putative Ca2+/H+ antiporter (TMEM165/GDT1 family)|nr:TMEM165/GDT1 family protein [Endomicrobium sp.]
MEIFLYLLQMSDRTQILAMTFALRFKALYVILAVIVATVLNHSLSVIVGRVISSMAPLTVTHLLALGFLYYLLF